MTHSNAHSSIVVRMFAVVLVAGAMLLGLFNSTATGQTSLIHHTIQKVHQNPPSMGRDFWFSMMSNYWGIDLGGKYMRIYITSPNNTTAYVESEGTITPVPIQAMKVGSFKVPEFWEMESSGIVESQAIHVYSKDADLTVYDMSHNDYTSDGSYIIPTIGWGTDYVVGAYASLFEGFGTYVYDLPSTLAVTADQDNTQVDITPSCDCRQTTNGALGGNGSATVVVFSAGNTYSWTLNRGQDLELMPVKASDPDNFDLTGTIVHSSQPVGLSGGSGCPNIPLEFPYCDHVEEMIPPVRTWAETYYATNWIQPPGSPDDYTRFLFIASQPGQTIYRHDCVTGDHTECVISNQYGIYWDELESGQKFWSKDPFLLVAYVNSATYPGGQNGQGDPAECVINPRENFTDTIVFQTPQSIGNIIPYTNYANIIVNDADAKYTYFDGQSIIGGKGAQCVDDTFEIFNIPKIAPGAHRVENRYKAMNHGQPSHGGVGAYIYGYGYDESYAWAGGFGTGTFHSPDTVAPLVDTINQCFNAFVHVSDSGLLPDGVHPQSGLSQIRLDSVYNMNYLPDVPQFVEGSGADTSGYGLFPVDETKEAFLRVDVFDLAGNESIITSIYKPLVDSITPELNNLGVTIASATNYGYDTITNDGQIPIKFTSIKLKFGDQGFAIDSADLSQLAPGKSRIIKISFSAKKSTKAVDTVQVSTSCNEIQAAVIGSGGAADFTVTSYHWSNVLLTSPNPTCYTGTVKIVNLSNIPITIDSAHWPDSVHFHAISKFPFVVPPAPGSYTFNVEYCPDSGSLTTENATQGAWFSKDVLVLNTSNPDPRFDSLTGNALAPAETFIPDQVIEDTCVQPGQTETVNFTVAATGKAGSVIKTILQSDPTDFVNLTGRLDQTGTTWAPADTIQSLAAQSTATISVTCNLPVGVNDTLIDTLTAIDGNNSVIGVRTVKIITHYFQESPVPPLNYGLLPYKSGKVVRIIPITNSSSTQPLIVHTIQIEINQYLGAYTLSLEAGQSLPDTLAPNTTIFDTLYFDPSYSFDAKQNTIIDINTNSCLGQQATVIAGVSVQGDGVTTYNATPILSCDTHLDTVTIFNPKPKSDTDDVVDTIVAASITGTSTAAFSFPTLSGQAITGLLNTTIDGTTKLQALPTTLTVPVLFTPPAVPAPGMQTFYDTITVRLRSNRGTDTTMTIALEGIAGSMQVTATAAIANITQSTLSGTNSAHASEQLQMPAMVSLNNGGLNAITTDMLGINEIKLTYVIPQRDLLRITGFNGILTGWQLKSGTDPVAQQTQGGNNPSETIVVDLVPTNPANVLTAAQLGSKAANFGHLDFTAELDTGAATTPVQLSSIELDGSNGSLPATCVNTVSSGDNYSLVSACGDQSLQLLMENKGQLIQFVGPATPDPAAGSDVTVKYANRGAAALTLAIFDELGNEVGRPVNNVYHDAGTWQVTCDVSKFASGTYTARLSGTSATGPMSTSTQFVVKH